MGEWRPLLLLQPLERKTGLGWHTAGGKSGGSGQACKYGLEPPIKMSLAGQLHLAAKRHTEQKSVTGKSLRI